MARRRRSDNDTPNDGDEPFLPGDDSGDAPDYAVPILRHEPRGEDDALVGEVSTGDPEAIEQIAAHFERHVGKVDGVFHEIVSDLVHIDVHCIPATPKRPYWTLFTTGMSERPMTVPEGHGLEAFRYAELMICLPPEWPLSPEAFKDERNYWPILWLKRLARFPHEYQTWLFQDHTVPNGDPPAPFASDTELCCLWLTPPFGVSEDFSPLALEDGRTVFFWSLVPLYQDEMEIKLRGGSQRLQAYLDKQRLTPDDLCIVDPERPRKRKRDLWRFRL